MSHGSRRFTMIFCVVKGYKKQVGVANYEKMY